MQTPYGVDYVKLYRSIDPERSPYILLTTRLPRRLFKYCAGGEHTFKKLHRISSKAGARVITLDEICSAPVRRAGYNEQYGLLGSNYTQTAP